MAYVGIGETKARYTSQFRTTTIAEPLIAKQQVTEHMLIYCKKTYIYNCLIPFVILRVICSI